MSDFLTGGQRRDSERIDVNDATECARWCEKLNVTAGELKAAVFYAGDKSEDVHRYLKERETHAESVPPPSMRGG